MSDTTIHRAELAGYSSVVGQPIMLLNKAGACIGQLALIGAQGDYKSMTAEVAVLINGDALRAEVDKWSSRAMSELGENLEAKAAPKASSSEDQIRADERSKVIAEAVKIVETQSIACAQFFRDHQKSPNVYDQLGIVADDLRAIAALQGGTK